MPSTAHLTNERQPPAYDPGASPSIPPPPRRSCPVLLVPSLAELLAGLVLGLAVRVNSSWPPSSQTSMSSFPDAQSTPAQLAISVLPLVRVNSTVRRPGGTVAGAPRQAVDGATSCCRFAAPRTAWTGRSCSRPPTDKHQRPSATVIAADSTKPAARMNSMTYEHQGSGVLQVRAERVRNRPPSSTVRARFQVPTDLRNGSHLARERRARLCLMHTNRRGAQARSL